jgi:hypothetical protein
MPDESSGRHDNSQLPHLIVPWAGSDHPYRGRAGGQPAKIRQIANRSGHAARLSAELEAAEVQARDLQADTAAGLQADGFALAVEGWSDEPGYALALQSLDTRGAKLLSVHPPTAESPERAVVWLPFGAVSGFLQRVAQYATELTSQGKPRNLPLVANIAEIRLAIMRDLWHEQEEFPPPAEARWWEVWLARLSAEHDPAPVMRAVAAEHEWPMVRKRQ